MKCYDFKPVAVAILLILPCKEVFGKVASECNELNELWSCIDSSLLPEKQNDYWTDEQRKTVRELCNRFAETHKPNCIIPAMVEDLALKPSEVNAFVYIWVVVFWNPEEVMALLEPIYEGSDSVRSQIASDFIAEIEEAKKEQMLNHHAGAIN